MNFAVFDRLLEFLSPDVRCSNVWFIELPHTEVGQEECTLGKQNGEI